MIPFTLAMAFGVRLMGAALTSGGVGGVGVVVVDDICISSSLQTQIVANARGAIQTKSLLLSRATDCLLEPVSQWVLGQKQPYAANGCCSGLLLCPVPPSSSHFLVCVRRLFAFPSPVQPSLGFNGPLFASGRNGPSPKSCGKITVCKTAFLALSAVLS